MRSGKYTLIAMLSSLMMWALLIMLCCMGCSIPREIITESQGEVMYVHHNLNRVTIGYRVLDRKGNPTKDKVYNVFQFDSTEQFEVGEVVCLTHKKKTCPQ